jgi:hypothetical protein
VVVGLNYVPEALMAPPVFSSAQLPRHAQPKSKLQKQEAETSAHNKQAEKNKKIIGGGAAFLANKKKVKKLEEEGNDSSVMVKTSTNTSAKDEMERMRQRVIDEYKAFKEKKRAMG